MNRYVCTVEYLTKSGKHRGLWNAVLFAEDEETAKATARRQCQRRRKAGKILDVRVVEKIGGVIATPITP